MPARNTLVQLLAPYTHPDSHDAQRHRLTDGQTDDRIMPIADHTVQQYDRLKTVGRLSSEIDSVMCDVVSVTRCWRLDDGSTSTPIVIFVSTIYGTRTSVIQTGRRHRRRVESPTSWRHCERGSWLADRVPWRIDSVTVCRAEQQQQQQPKCDWCQLLSCGAITDTRQDRRSSTVCWSFVTSSREDSSFWRFISTSSFQLIGEIYTHPVINRLLTIYERQNSDIAMF